MLLIGLGLFIIWFTLLFAPLSGGYPHHFHKNTMELRVASKTCFKGEVENRIIARVEVIHHC